jgi:hypothetical protein
VAKKTSEWFWGGSVPQNILDELRTAATDTGANASRIPTRATATDVRSAIQADTPDVASVEVRRAVVDLLFASSGVGRQIGVPNTSSEPGSPGGSTPGEDGPDGILSFLWMIIQKPIELVVWLLGFVAEMLAYLVGQLWPHFLGITMMLVMLLFTVVSAIALWKWSVLLDWTLGCVWVIAWFLPMALGMALINAASDTGTLGVITGSDPPASGTLRIVGGCLVMMSPIIMQAFIFPGFDAIAKLGGAVYGTGFKIVGAAAQIAALAGGVTAGIVGAAVGGVAGAAAAGGGKPGAGSGPETKGSTSPEAQAMSKGGGGAGGDDGARSRILASASRAASFGMSAGKGVSNVVGAGEIGRAHV